MSDIYTAISFAPVQGFIERSRKLRDLYGASIILSYLSQKIVEEFHQDSKLKVISPGRTGLQEGMPNRILIRGLIDRDLVQKALLKHWQALLLVCREWVEKNVPAEYHWAQKETQISYEKGEWERWGTHTWELFWGRGDAPQSAMDDLETRKLKRDWIAINWMGESSSLSGTDAIAWPRLGRCYKPGEYCPGQSLTRAEQEEQELFYRRLSWLLDDPNQRIGKSHLSLAELIAYEEANVDGIGRYIAVNERLSIPELVKRLITYDQIDADRSQETKLGIKKLREKPDDPEFKDIYRESGYWTGWFMGDGDEVGKKLKTLAARNPDNLEKCDRDITRFSELMRDWGKEFKDNKSLFPEGKGRVIYAGGDDFLGVLYSEEPLTKMEELKPVKPKPVKPIEAWDWLHGLPKHWKSLQENLKTELDLECTYSLGFVWAGNRVPQRDILQHCREAEKRSKSLDRDRVTIRVVFNSGQFVQWTCPWDCLHILGSYRDRDGQTGKKASWTHLYNDWAQLQARHAVNLKQGTENIDDYIALALFKIYFGNQEEDFLIQNCQHLTGKDYSSSAIIEWIDGLVEIGWQLCSNS
jgi:CRISPR-associated protein Cmr2